MERRTLGKCKCKMGRRPLGRRTMGMATRRLGVARCGWRCRGYCLGLGLSVRLCELRRLLGMGRVRVGECMLTVLFLYLVLMQSLES